MTRVHYLIPQSSVLAMASPSLTFLENYHWKGYTVDTIVNNSNTMMCLHRGNFPMHRHCKNIEIGCVPFNLLEAWVWIQMEKWNILWADDETWLPLDGKCALTRTPTPRLSIRSSPMTQMRTTSRSGWRSLARVFTPSRLRSDTMVMLVGRTHAALPL